MKKIKILFIIVLGSVLNSCEKGFLDKKPDKSLLVPNKLSDFRALLDAEHIKLVPALGLVSSDDYELSAALMVTLTPTVRNAYLWQKDIYEGSVNSEWNAGHANIFYANVVLEGLNGITNNSDLNFYNELRGEALFRRAFSYHHLAQVYCPPYQYQTSKTTLGLSLRTTADVNVLPQRSNLEDTFRFILSDLENSILLLPLNAKYKIRPNRAAAHALLARVYLNMGNYEKALSHAQACLKLNDRLIDFNDLNVSATRPLPNALPNGNDEILYYDRMAQIALFTSTLANVNPELFSMYESNDLRKQIFYNVRPDGNILFKGTYSGANSSTSLFAGLATDEVYLISAEAKIRVGSITEGLKDLNTLLSKRYKSGTFVPYNLHQKNEALAVIYAERRKELAFRGMRWSDLRRFNLEPEFKMTLKKRLNGIEYVLLPNDIRYTLPLPDDEIRGSKVEQNPR